jgi:hypothetical protein
MTCLFAIRNISGLPLRFFNSEFPIVVTLWLTQSQRPKILVDLEPHFMVGYEVEKGKSGCKYKVLNETRAEKEGSKRVEDLREIAILLVPIVLIQLGLLAFGLWDWAHRKKFRYLGRWAWFVCIVAVNIIGPLLYLLLGREEG